MVGAKAEGIPDLIKNEKDGFLFEPGDIDGFVGRLKHLQDGEFRKQMGKEARIEAERWGWETATSVLRNIQYEKALINFHSREFGGFGRPGTRSLCRLFDMRMNQEDHASIAIGRILQEAKPQHLGGLK